MCVFFCINALENPVFWSLIKCIHKHKLEIDVGHGINGIYISNE